MQVRLSSKFPRLGINLQGSSIVPCQIELNYDVQLGRQDWSTWSTMNVPLSNIYRNYFIAAKIDDFQLPISGEPYIH